MKKKSGEHTCEARVLMAQTLGLVPPFPGTGGRARGPVCRRARPQHRRAFGSRTGDAPRKAGGLPAS